MRFRIVKSILTIEVLLFLGVAFSACDKTMINVPEKSSVTFTVDWAGVKSTDDVATASIYLYPTTGEQPIILTGVSAEKTTTVVPAGTYRVIAYNENLANIRVRNSGAYSTFEAYVVPTARPDTEKFNSKGTSIETSIPSVEYLNLLTGTASRELIVDGVEPYNFTLRPKTATSSYRFTVRIPTRLEFTEVSAVLGGIASRMGLFEAKPLADDISSVDIPLTTTLNDSKDTILCRGSVETFGVDPSNRNVWSNTLYMHLVPRVPDDKLKTNYEVDLTSYFDKYNSLNLDIDIKVESPNPDVTDDVIFIITVKPWIEEDGGHIDMEPANIVGRK